MKSRNVDRITDMGHMVKLILDLSKSAGPWLNKKWLYILPLFGCLFAIILISIDIIPTFPEQSDRITIQYYNIGAFFGLPIVFVLIWFIWTQYYLRLGHGVKIGFAYDWQNVDMKDWKQIKQTLSELLKNEKIKSKVCLKFVPFRATQVESSKERFVKRYNFTILANFEYSKTRDEKIKNSLIIHGAPNDIGPYIKQILNKSLNVLARRPLKKDCTLKDILKHQALSMHDMLLLLVAAHNFATGNYLDAHTILFHLDKSLESICDPKSMPRFSIRELDAITCTESLHFSMKKVPCIDELKKRLKFAEKGNVYFDDFTVIYTSISRAKFLAGDLDGAYQITEKFNKSLNRLKSENIEINLIALMKLYLNLGFLSFAKGLWHKAYLNYSEMLKCPNLKEENWSEVIYFIDYVLELERFEGICVLQVFYRKLAGQKVPKAIDMEAQKWINEDGSRRVFNQLLSKVRLIQKQIVQSENKYKRKPSKKNYKRSKKRRQSSR